MQTEILHTAREKIYKSTLSKEKQLSSPVTDDLVTKGISVIESCLWVIASFCMVETVNILVSI